MSLDLLCSCCTSAIADLTRLRSTLEHADPATLAPDRVRKVTMSLVRIADALIRMRLGAALEATLDPLSPAATASDAASAIPGHRAGELTP